MTEYSLPYGHGTIPLYLPDRFRADWIEPAYAAPAVDPLHVVRDALENPVDGLDLSPFRAVRSVAIAVNDKTRPVPHEHLLPPLLEHLHMLGIPAEVITFYIATGTHIPMTPDEFPRVIPPEIFQKYHIVSHDCDDLANLVQLGSTTRGTPIWANRRYIESDMRIAVGNIEPHHFAGFSGGYKSAAIGLAGRLTINQNHAMLVEPGAQIGEFASNPLRQDIEEIGDAFRVHFALNAILNGEKKIVRVVFGSPRAVMQAGIPISQQICQVPVSGGKYDLVIASVGGAPKDINFYQSQKGLTHASLFTRDGGAIILAAECPEGSGSSSYEAFMEGIDSPQAVFDKFRSQGFRVGPHKALQVARISTHAKIYLVSQLPAAQVSRLLIIPASTIEDAVQLAMEGLSPTPGRTFRAAILPRATNTIPVF